MNKTIILITTILFLNCKENMKFNLDKTLKIERRDMIVMEIDTYLNEKSDYGENIEELNSSQQTFLFV